MYIHVIMPVASDPNALEKQILIKKIAENEGFLTHFPDYLPYKPVFDLKSAIDDMRSASFIIADLSLERPSCYYELGLAEAIEKKVYLIAKFGTDIHQTSKRNHVSFFKNMNEFECLVREIILKSKREQKKGQFHTGVGARSSII